MTLQPSTMVDARLVPNAGPSYLMQYLLTTDMPLLEIGQLDERAQDIVTIAYDMVCEYASLLPNYILFDAYYNGTPPLAKEPKRLTTKYRELLNMGVSNWLGLVVDVVDERLQIESIASSTQPAQDPTAWAWWQANNMDSTSSQVHLAALKYGICYASAWPVPGGVKIQGESPLCTFVRFDEDDNAVAAIRVYAEDCDGMVNVDLTLGDYQFRLVTVEPVKTMLDGCSLGWLMSGRAIPFAGAAMDFTNVRFAFREDVPPVVRNELGVVPYVRLRAQPDLLGGYRSEIEGLLSVADRINKTIFDRLLAQEFAAFPQRWVTGIDVPVDPETGKPREPFNAAVDRIWTASAPDSAFGQFPAAELQGYLDAVTADIQALATQSRTPPHYLIAGMGAFPSGESVRATESGLTRKVDARQRSFGDGWQKLLHLCAVATGEATLAQDDELNVVWRDVEARSEAELVDALLKMGSLGVPVEALWQRWGASPTEIAHWSALRKAAVAAAQTTADKNVALLPSLDVALPPGQPGSAVSQEKALNTTPNSVPIPEPKSRRRRRSS